MSMLRILRNLAVLLILAVAVLVSTPRPAAANKKKGACAIAGQQCGLDRLPCCHHLVCVAFSGGRAFCFKDPDF